MSPAGGSWKWWVCGALLLATMLNYMDRQTLSLTATQLKTEITLDDGRYGALEEWFSYSFAIGGIFFGFVADRVGPRRLYPVVLFGWSLAGIATPLANWPGVVAALGDPAVPGQGEFRWLFLCRTLLGFCEAGHWPCALLTARNILNATQRPLGNSILQSGASFGAVLTPLVVEAIRAAGLPWQGPFVIIGLIGLAWVPLWLVLIRPGDLRYLPAERKTKSPDPATPAPPRLKPLLFLVQLLTLTVIVVTISLAWQFQRAWLPKYLKEFHHYSEATANYFTAGYYVVAGLGSLLALMAAGAGSLGAHPQYYSLAQELPARHMGFLSGVLAAASWVAVGRMQGAMGAYIKETESYDLPLVVTGLAPLAGLLAMAVWAVVSLHGTRTR
jgi:MFS transporter, ACS family, aldohexuronate transporter